MTQKTVTIEIDELGNSSIDLENFKGQGCSKVEKDFRGSDTVTSARTKREYMLEPAKKQVSQNQ
jgi:hypothetical protein